jgi:Protein of unknown function (DUF2628)
MPTYTVHAPPLKAKQTAPDPERFLFVRDGFHFWAFIFAPLWLLLHRLWLAFFGYLVLSALLSAALYWSNARSVGALAGLLIALLVGFEAPTLWRWTLARRRWKTLGFVVAEDNEMAEQRFYSSWTARAGETSPPPAAPAEPTYAMPTRRAAPAAPDVIGLFPEPGGPR